MQTRLSSRTPEAVQRRLIAMSRSQGGAVVFNRQTKKCEVWIPENDALTLFEKTAPKGASPLLLGFCLEISGERFVFSPQKTSVLNKRAADIRKKAPV